MTSVSARRRLEGRWGIPDSDGQWLREPLTRPRRTPLRARARSAHWCSTTTGLAPGKTAAASRYGADAPEIADRYAQFGLQRGAAGLPAAQRGRSLGPGWTPAAAWPPGSAGLPKARPLLLRAVELGNSDALNDLGCLVGQCRPGPCRRPRLFPARQRRRLGSWPRAQPGRLLPPGSRLR